MKLNKIIRIAVSIILLVLTGLLVIVSIKPGAAVFFDSKELDLDKVEIVGNQIGYPITLSSTHYDLDTLLIRENGALLVPIKVGELPNRESAVFAVETVGEDDFIIRIIPVSGNPENVDLSAIEILVRPFYITHPALKVLAVVFSVGLILTTVSILFNLVSRKKIFSVVFGFLQIWDDPGPIAPMIKRKSKLLLSVIRQAVFVSFFFVSMEWLFFTTKSSFMDLLSFGQKLAVLFDSSFFLWIAIVLFILVIFVLDFVSSITITPILNIMYCIPSAFVLAGSALLLFDNFTYTVFGFGVSSATSWIRVIYGIGFIVAFILFLRFLLGKVEKKVGRKLAKFQLAGAGIILLAVVISMVVQFNPVNLQASGDISGDMVRTPNIILVSDDGVNAANMSVYGYERETTPFLETLAPSSLMMLNNLTNANTSTGSDTALLTGKLPFDTGVMFSPNTLEGNDTLQHMPGILKKLGYRTMSIGVPQYVDMGMINFQNGFDSINGETNVFSSLVSFISAYGYNDAAYFSEVILGRVGDRLLHISFIKTMDNAYLLVTDPSPTSVGVNMTEAFELLTDNLTAANQSDQPLFAHIHMITTHGAMFYPRTQFFSVGMEQNEGWMTDFYDDAILDFDHWLEDLAKYLKNHGLYEETIIVVYTDHGEQWSIEDRIPLIIHFPNDDHSGEVAATSQNLDIAPTLLEYMGVDVPEWMAGESLLGELDRTRLIYSAKINPDAFGREEKYEDVIAPPFYQFETIAVSQCQYIYEINLDEGTMVRKTIADYVDPCGDQNLATPDQIWDSAMTLLSDYGFQIPSGWDDPKSYQIE